MYIFNKNKKMFCDDMIKLKLGISRDEEIPSSETVYLDHAGCPLPAKSLLKEVYEDLLLHPMANPHSVGGGISNYTEKIITQMRIQTLDFLSINPSEYEVIFTANATAAIKLVVDMIDWKARQYHFVYPQNIHTSLLGLRPFCHTWECLSYDSLFNFSEETVTNSSSTANYNEDANIFIATPAECNMSGAKLSLKRMNTVLNRFLSAKTSGKIYWLLDIAKFCATSPLDFTNSFRDLQHRPDFLTLSFYKIFGYPTGIGALIVKKEILPDMMKSYFGGGTLLAGATDINFMVPRPKTSPKHYEDGTINFHGIAALRHGFHFISKLGGMSLIQQYTFSLTEYLMEKMTLLTHRSTGFPLCIIYNQSSFFSQSSRGPIVLFNLQYANAEPIGFNEVNQSCLENHIQIRTGCFCNLGGCQYFLHLSGSENEANYHLGRVCSDQNELDVINKRQTGACRISLGFGSTRSDCDRLVEFLEHTFLDKLPQKFLPSLPSTLQRVSAASAHDSYSFLNQESSLFWHHSIQSFPVSSQRRKSPNIATVASPASSTCGSVILAAIFVYPIKSCAGVRVDDWPITSEGLQYDRYFAIIDSQGKVITQKQFPILALVQPSFHIEQLDDDFLGNEELQKKRERITLHLTAPQMESRLVIPLEDLQFRSKGVSAASEIQKHHKQREESMEFTVCGRKVFGQRISKDANQWFTEYLVKYGRSNKSTAVSDSSDHQNNSYSLVRFSSDSSSASLKVAKKNETSNPHSYANTAQYLLLSLESVASLIQLIYQSKSTSSSDLSPNELSIKVENFRPNLVVTTTALSVSNEMIPHQEDTWSSLSVPISPALSQNGETTNENENDICSNAKIRLQVTGPCSRCSMVNVNGSTGVMSCRAFEALADYRKMNRQVYFGQFLSFHSFESATSFNEGEDHKNSMQQSDFRLSVGSIIKVLQKEN